MPGPKNAAAPWIIATAGGGLLCLATQLAYEVSGLGSPHSRPSAAALWFVFGCGFILTGWGLIAGTISMTRKHRAVLAVCLFVVGILLSILALGIAHAGPALLPLAIPSLLFGFFIGVWALSG